MRALQRPLTAIVAAALLGVFPVTAAEFQGRAELLEKGRPSADKTLAVDAARRFRIPDVPANAGQVMVWNERSAPTTRELTLPVASALTLGIEINMPRIPPHRNKLGEPHSGGGYG